ncbi:hypothetical protein QBC34DRAFT_476616 [Podospora aff. communis PSN243]|uniref:Uncharacterized protein n=1 Tax=Podospora aff. communis PSN243 TaxID=3040156 RepID=A0AAV9G670_9PEZI|nr:hypothetical protein QBC34DRAFT_476616 [Podospora aff. communis PSN243]
MWPFPNKSSKRSAPFPGVSQPFQAAVLRTKRLKIHDYVSLAVVALFILVLTLWIFAQCGCLDARPGIPDIYLLGITILACGPGASVRVGHFGMCFTHNGGDYECIHWVYDPTPENKAKQMFGSSSSSTGHPAENKCLEMSVFAARTVAAHQQKVMFSLQFSSSGPVLLWNTMHDHLLDTA